MLTYIVHRYLTPKCTYNSFVLCCNFFFNPKKKKYYTHNSLGSGDTHKCKNK